MSISLTNVETYTVGASAVETNNVSCAVSPQIDFTSMTITWTMQGGSLSGNTFTYGARSKPISVTVNVNAGTWVSNGLSGTITPTQQTNLHTQLINMRNNMESFAIASGIVSGTQTAWT